MKKVYTFWTGGFDSTFRILQLSRENVTVQPIYVVDPGRKSASKEITAMEKIRSMLGNNRAVGYLRRFFH